MGCGSSSPAETAPEPAPARGLGRSGPGLGQDSAPGKKVLVMSCPETGTLDPYGGPPYDQQVMDRVAQMSHARTVKMGFDRAGTTTTVKADEPLFAAVAELAQAGDTAGAKAKVRETQWLYGYITAAKRTISVESQGFDGVLTIVCINGGTITTVEGEEMQKVIVDAKKDAAKSDLKVRIELRTMEYCDFLREFDASPEPEPAPEPQLKMSDEAHDKVIMELVEGGQPEKIMGYCQKADYRLDIRRTFEAFIAMEKLELALAFLGEMLCANMSENVTILVHLATKHTELVGAKAMIALFENTCVDRLFLYLNAILATVTDPDVIFKYIEVATKCSQFKEVERVTRESIYDPAKVKDFLMGQQLQDPRPLINVCDKHGFLDDLVRYLYASDRMKVIEQYVLEENPKNLPVVAGSLVDLGVEEGVIKELILAVGRLCPARPLVQQIGKRGRLELLMPWLEARVATEHLIERCDVATWAKVLSEENTAVSDCEDVEQVSLTVRAFTESDARKELVELLNKIVMGAGSRFSTQKSLQNMLILAAAKCHPGRVMEFVDRLDSIDAAEIAPMLATEGLFEEALALYNKIGDSESAIGVLLGSLKDIERATELAQRCDEPAVWSVLEAACPAWARWIRESTATRKRARRQRQLQSRRRSPSPSRSPGPSRSQSWSQIYQSRSLSRSAERPRRSWSDSQRRSPSRSQIYQSRSLSQGGDRPRQSWSGSWQPNWSPGSGPSRSPSRSPSRGGSMPWGSWQAERGLVTR